MYRHYTIAPVFYQTYRNVNKSDALSLKDGLLLLKRFNVVDVLQWKTFLCGCFQSIQKIHLKSCLATNNTHFIFKIILFCVLTIVSLVGLIGPTKDTIVKRVNIK